MRIPNRFFSAYLLRYKKNQHCKLFLQRQYLIFCSTKKVIIPVVPDNSESFPQVKFRHYAQIISKIASQALSETIPHNKLNSPVMPFRQWASSTVYVDYEIIENGVRQASQNSWDLLLGQHVYGFYFFIEYPIQKMANFFFFFESRNHEGVIGICLCKQFPDLKKAQNLFSSLTNAFRPTISKCFAFDPMENQADLEKSSNLFMIPKSAEPDHLIFYVRTLILDIVSSILLNFESWIFEKSQNELPVYLRLISIPNEERVSMEKSLKRQQARIEKLKGDFCLKSSSPRDAMIHYKTAVDYFKRAGDSLWTAVALESLISASFTSESSSNVTPFMLSFPHYILSFFCIQCNILKKKLKEEQFLEYMQEALLYYTRANIMPLTIRFLLKSCHFLTLLNKRSQVVELLMEIYDKTEKLSIKEQAQVTGQIAFIFKKLNYFRKFAFFMRESAVLYHKLGYYATAHRLLLSIVAYYQLEDLRGEFSQNIRSKSNFLIFLLILFLSYHLIWNLFVFFFIWQILCFC